VSLPGGYVEENYIFAENGTPAIWPITCRFSDFDMGTKYSVLKKKILKK
jgi:hypothetical protein